MNTQGEIQTEFLVRNNRTTTDSFITDTMLRNWFEEAYHYCAGYKKWPFTEGRVSTTWASYTTNEDGYIVGEYPEGWKADSVRRLTIGGKQVDKKNFYKFTEYLEKNSSNSDRIFSDYGRRIYVNPNIDVSGTVTAWGQYTPTMDYSLLSDKTVFSDFDPEGNEAIVEKMTAYLKRREHLPQEADMHEAIAIKKMEELYEKTKDEQSSYQDTNNDGMFKRFDVVEGGFRDDINTNQF